eukprot:3014842-Pleurochrysis_carterae.AAC.1
MKLDAACLLRRMLARGAADREFERDGLLGSLHTAESKGHVKLASGGDNGVADEQHAGSQGV